MSEAGGAETFTATNSVGRRNVGTIGLSCATSAVQVEERNEPARCEQHGNDLL